MSKYISEINGHALVLGGSGGIGRKIAQALVANGASAVTFTYNKNKQAADELTKELQNKGVAVYADQIDPLDERTFKEFLGEAVSKVGSEISVAVNAIGISRDKPLSEQTLEDMRKVYDVNVHGNFLATRAIAERMKAKGVLGSIVFISSDNTLLSWTPTSAPYDSAKRASEFNIVNHFAYEYRDSRIRFVAIAPGWVNTSMNDTMPPDELREFQSRIYLGRFAEPEEIAKVVAFVAGSGGSFINGTTIYVNGGFR